MFKSFKSTILNPLEISKFSLGPIKLEMYKFYVIELKHAEIIFYQWLKHFDFHSDLIGRF